MLFRLAAVTLTVINFHARRWWREYAMLVTVILIASVVFYGLFLAPPSDFPVGAPISIEKGATLGEIAAVLKEHHAVKSAFIFEVIVRAAGMANSIDAGTYLFDRRLATIAVAYRLARGIYGMPEIKVTIPEGSTNREVADRIGEAFSPEFRAAFFAQASLHEGYLFPETYHFSAADTPESVLKHMRDTFDLRTRALAEEVLASGRTLSQVVTMASILEGEANNETDMKIVAGILWKRLDMGMALQVDAEPSTYDRPGLPSTPINNPGLVALTATLTPTKTPYLFYLTGKDGKMYYARTYAEHQVNLAKYLK